MPTTPPQSIALAPTADRRLRHELAALIPVVLVPLLFAAAFIIPAHSPQANSLPIAVAGPTASAQPFLRALGDVRIIPVADPAAATGKVRHRDAYAALDVTGRPLVSVSSGASFVAATLVRQSALQAGVPPTRIRELEPLPTGDRRGTVLNLAVLALLITSIIGAATAVARREHTHTPAKRHGGLALAAVLIGSGIVGLLKAIDALPGSFPVEASLTAGLVVAVALVASGLMRLRGPAGTSLGFLLFLVLANPGSGLASAPELLPTPWKQLGGLMPPGAAGNGLRGAEFFANRGAIHAAVVLAAWASFGLVLNVIADNRLQRNRPTVASEAPAPINPQTTHPHRPAQAA